MNAIRRMADAGSGCRIGVVRRARRRCGRSPGRSAEQVLRTWYKLVLELVRHTPTYSPPVASRAFAYLGVTAFEAAASGSGELQSLAGQLNGLHGRAAARRRARPMTRPW